MAEHSGFGPEPSVSSAARIWLAGGGAAACKEAICFWDIDQALAAASR